MFFSVQLGIKRCLQSMMPEMSKRSTSWGIRQNMNQTTKVLIMNENQSFKRGLRHRIESSETYLSFMLALTQETGL